MYVLQCVKHTQNVQHCIFGIWGHTSQETRCYKFQSGVNFKSHSCKAITVFEALTLGAPPLATDYKFNVIQNLIHSPCKCRIAVCNFYCLKQCLLSMIWAVPGILAIVIPDLLHYIIERINDYGHTIVRSLQLILCFCMVL